MITIGAAGRGKTKAATVDSYKNSKFCVRKCVTSIFVNLVNLVVVQCSYESCGS